MGPARIQATGETSNDAHVGEFEQAYSTSGPVARGAQVPAAGDMACDVQVRLFNNALLAEDNRDCGGQSASFWGLYYRQASQ